MTRDVLPWSIAWRWSGATALSVSLTSRGGFPGGRLECATLIGTPLARPVAVPPLPAGRRWRTRIPLVTAPAALWLEINGGDAHSRYARVVLGPPLPGGGAFPAAYPSPGLS
jgi:hypothetical protein